jgi:hypothetical protein
LYGLRKAAERDGDARNKIASEFRGRRDQETILANIEKQALFTFFKGNEDRCMGDDARIETTFDSRS